MHRDISKEGSCGKMSPLPSTPQSSTALIKQSAAVASPSIGVNLRVTGHCSQGGRKYMEDFFSVAYHQSENAKDLEYAFVGIYDGHGGSEAATFAKEHLMMEIINQKLFWSDNDQDVLRAIREGYIATHYAMWREQEKWPKTATGLPSTAGTTATVAFIRRERIYIGHVGDSGIVLGYQNSNESFWRAKPLTQDHKPESAEEKARIINSGGKVVVKSGVPRVVWNRPRTGHKGPVRRSTPIDEIPFLAVARSLGDLWSYNSALNEFVVSPDPDVKVIKINPKTFRCLIFGTDGLWNVISAGEAVDTVREKEEINDRISRMRGETNSWCNPSKGLVEKALKTWSSKKMRADNTSVVTVILYPPGANPTKENSANDFMNSYGEIHPSEGYVHLSSPCHQQKCLPSSLYEPKLQVYDTDSFNQAHHLPHYDTIAPSPTMRLHLLQQPPHQEGCMRSYIEENESIYINNYETNCDTNGYLYYEDHVNNSYLNSFTESYNSLLTSSREHESNSRSNASSNNNEGAKCNPSEYHSYHSLHHTGLAGHDRVQHHYPNNEYEMEQRLYQEQCMSAEEGYSLTKLETRGEQQLRGSNTAQSTSNCVQAFQIFGGESSGATETIYNQYNNISSTYQNSYHRSDSSNSNFLVTYEDGSRCYESSMDITANIEETPLSSGRTTSLCIERLDSFEIERLATEQPESISCLKSSAQEENYLEIVVEENYKDETIQINEISSSVGEELAPPPEPPQLQKNEHKKTQKEQLEQPAICENVFDSTPMKKPSIPKLMLYTNVPNENHRTQRRPPAIQQHPRNFEKRMLRSMTVDYSKRTLRSRNSLSKDMKAKSAASTTLRRSTIVQSKFIKAIKSSANAENANVISRKSLNLRSRQVMPSAIWSTADSASMTVSSSTLTSSSSSNSSQRHQRKSKPISFCDNSSSSKVTITGSESSDLLVGTVAAKIASVSSQFNHLQQQMSMSFAKRTNIRNSGWGSAKTTIQTRNRVQKRLSR